MIFILFLYAPYIRKILWVNSSACPITPRRQSREANRLHKAHTDTRIVTAPMTMSGTITGAVFAIPAQRLHVCRTQFLKYSWEHVLQIGPS